MALDPYTSCPCGSGKKFKWCCQPIRQLIDKAYQKDAEGQHEAALKLMDEVVAENQGNPEAWGSKARLLYQNGKVEEAETALQKAFDINPKYPSGFLLKGLFRYNEGEIPGALLLFRKAAEYFDPEAHDFLGEIYSLITNSELKLNRPVAARVALERAIHCTPANQELRDGMENIFGKESRLPATANREYRFLSPAATVSGDRRAKWDRLLQHAVSGKLSDAVAAFERLTEEEANDAAAWYNLALARAWLGDNAGALDALDRYVNLTPNEDEAAAAWALGEVLRCGQGMDDRADVHEYSVVYQIRDVRPLGGLLQEWEAARRLLVLPSGDEQGVVSAMVLESPTGVLTAAPSTLPAPFAANMLLVRNVIRFWTPKKESLERLRTEIEQRAGSGMSEGHSQVGNVAFADAVLPAVAFPVGTMDKDLAERQVLDHAQHYFEDAWIHQPLRSLNGMNPLDAAGHGVLRKKLLGVILFLQQCAAGGILGKYDFERLRRKLGLVGTPSVQPGPGGDSKLDIASLGAAGLAELAVEALSDDQLEQAYQTALKLDAHELAMRFIQTLIVRPPSSGKTDRYPWYSYLVQRALQDNRLDEALDWVNEGEKADCEQNEGGRRNDYELRRGQVHGKRGEVDLAQDVFQRLIDRAPTNMKYRGSAAETMLALKQPGRALKFAEEGLVTARQQNDRDSEGYLMELAAAARKQGA